MNFKKSINAIFSSLAQIAFSNKPINGLLILLAIFFVSPFGAAGALIGASIAVESIRPKRRSNNPYWLLGILGYNPAILGIIWGATLSRLDSKSFLFLPSVFLCIAIDRFTRPYFESLKIPPLAFSSLITAWIFETIFLMFGDSFWISSNLISFGNIGAIICVFLVGLVLFLEAPLPALSSFVIVAIFSSMSGQLLFNSWIGPVSLWGFTVAPAFFCCFAIFLPNSKIGVQTGILATISSSLIWIVYYYLNFKWVPEPLMMPFILGTWISILITLKNKDKSRLSLNPLVWDAVKKIKETKKYKGKTIVLSGAGISTASGIPDYASGIWLPRGDSVAEYEYGNFLTSPLSRKKYWSACSNFRNISTKATPNISHNVLADLEKKGWINSIVTQNVDGLHQKAGSINVIELHGNIQKVKCLNCQNETNWPQNTIWENAEMICEICNGFLKPSVIAIGENLNVKDWEQSKEKFKTCDSLIIIGTQLKISSAVELVAEARRNSAKIIFINPSSIGMPIFSEDTYLPFTSEKVLPSISLLLE
ncbi:MAG: urea transporter [Nitrospinota bacterium]|nr:urea transporter [Nitrospinota bacterium]